MMNTDKAINANHIILIRDSIRWHVDGKDYFYILRFAPLFIKIILYYRVFSVAKIYAIFIY